MTSVTRDPELMPQREFNPGISAYDQGRMDRRRKRDTCPYIGWANRAQWKKGWEFQDRVQKRLDAINDHVVKHKRRTAL